jgi:hypothetical protein
MQDRSWDGAAQFGNECRNKVPHTSKRLATGALRVLKAAPDVEGAERLNVYKCKACGHWHVGHTRRRRAA